MGGSEKNADQAIGAPGTPPPNNAIILAQQQKWSGPLPAPADLEHFNDIVPGSADRILRMAEAEGEHARKMQSRSVTWTIITTILGQFFGFGIACGGLYGSYLLALAGHPWVAATMAGGSLATIVLGFLKRPN